MGVNKMSEKEMGLTHRIELPTVKLHFVVGIDPGTKTGFAVYCKRTKILMGVETVKVHQAFNAISNIKRIADKDGHKIFVRVEDARKRKWFGPGSNAKQQGAGAIKIQCKQWEEFLRTEGISFEMVAPAKIQTKVDAKKFKMITGWPGRTSNHARDAAMMVYGL